MAVSNTTNIILHFTEMKKQIIIDVNEIMNSAFSNFTNRIFKTSLLIKKINGDENISSEQSKKCIEFLYKNKFRINGQQIITDTEYESHFSTSTIKPFIINHTIQSPKLINGTPDTNPSKYINKEVYQDLGILYTLTFDSFNDPIDFTIEIELQIINYISDDMDQLENYYINGDVYIDDYRCSQYSFFKNQSKMINSNMESFMLLRTNPKLTGNIKLVIDTDNKLYLDSFKVSTTSILNKKEYRHQEISADGDYAHDVYKVFNTVSPTELYNVYPDSYNPHKNYFDLNLQIENIYEYGAESNTDSLYHENMHILAPLYLGKHIPDYFLILKSDRITTTNYNNTNSTEFKQMLSDAKPVQIYDLRRSSTIGKYLYNYHKQIKKYFSGSCKLQFIEQDNDQFINNVYDSSREIYIDVPNPNYRQGTNTWCGLVYDKGILASKSETSYFANNTINGEDPQENFDMFLLNGFQRNKLLFPNIINLDFMFNDNDSEDLSIHNYFGLYLTENDFITFNQIITDTYKNNNKVYYFDENNKEINLIDTPINVIENEEYSDRIFFMTTLNDCKYLSTMDDVNYFVKTKVNNKPYKNLLSVESQLVKQDDEQSFITLDFTEQIKAGEHIKFITLNNTDKGYKEHIVLEIIGSNDRRLINCDNYIYPYIETNTPDYTIQNNDKIYTKIYRIPFYVNEVDEGSDLAPLSEQIKRICAAINKFDNFIKVSSFDDETLAVISSYKNTYCQHILSDRIEEDDEEEIIDPIRYFNYNNLATCYIIENLIDLYREEDVPFANNGFELYGNRYSNIVKFIDFEDYSSNYIYEIYKDVYEELKNVPYPIISTINGYFPIIKHHVHECHVEFTEFEHASNLSVGNEIFNSVVSPWDVKCSIIVSKYKCTSNNNQINICSPLQSNIALMGINQIKDLDTYTDIKETAEYKTALHASFAAGEKVSLNNGDPRLRLFTSYKLISGEIKNLPISANMEFMLTSDSIVYANNMEEESHHIMYINSNYIEFNQDTLIELTDLDKLEIYTYTTDKPILNASAYFKDKTNISTSNLKIPLVPMVNCQWKSNGVYFDNNSILDVNTLNKTYSTQGNFVENSYTPAGDTNNQYIVNKLNDLIDYSNETVMTIKNLILSNDYNGFIKKYLIANFKIDTAIGYYNPNVQTLEFIYYGILFKISMTNAKYKNDIKLNQFNNYEIFIINNYDGSLKNEMFIDQDNEFILFINHIYCINDLYSSESLKIFNKNNNIENVKYNWFSAPYTYKYIDFAVLNNNAYLYKDSNLKLTSTNTKYLVELDLPIYKDSYVEFDEEPIYAYFSLDSSTSPYKTLYGYDNLKSYDEYENQYTLITQDVNTDSAYNYNSSIGNLVSLYALNNTDYEQKVYDYRQHEMLMVKYSSYIKSSYVTEYNNDIKLNLYMNTFMYGDLNIYIMNGSNEYKEFNINNNYKPITITVSRPNQIKFNQGFFNPNFVDIFNFNIEDQIQKEINLDTLYGNTQISSINSIQSYYQNKILSKDASCNLNYFTESYKSPLSTCWDKDIYRLYSDNDTYSYIPGYSTGIQDKMMFGSTCLVLHNNYIELNKWDYNDTDNYASLEIDENNVNTETSYSYNISLNLTKTFYEYIINSNFQNNWNFINDPINVKTYINNYISNTLQNYYNFKSNIEVSLYKIYNPKGNKALSDILLNNSTILDIDDTAAFIKEMPSDITNYELEQSIKTEFNEVNNEIILNISISKYENYYFYPIVKIFKY